MAAPGRQGDRSSGRPHAGRGRGAGTWGADVGQGLGTGGGTDVEGTQGGDTGWGHRVGTQRVDARCRHGVGVQGLEWGDMGRGHGVWTQGRG